MQPHSGASANMAAYYAVLEPGDTVLGMRLDHGGHLTHGSPVNFSGRYYHFVAYGVRREDERIDFDEVRDLAREHRPKLIVAGATAYPREIDSRAFREIADEVGALLMVDMAHIAGLVAGRPAPEPGRVADIVSSTTHKTLAARAAASSCAAQELAQKIDKAVFPGLQGGPLDHVIAAKAVCFAIAMTEPYREYQGRSRPTRRRSPTGIAEQGGELLTGGTDTHLVQLDLRQSALSGKDMEERLHDSLHDGQPQHGAVRRAPADRGLGRPDRHAGGDDARPRRGRRARGRQRDRRGDQPGRRPGGAARAHRADPGRRPLYAGLAHGAPSLAGAT